MNKGNQLLEFQHYLYEETAGARRGSSNRLKTLALILAFLNLYDNERLTLNDSGIGSTF